MLKRTKRTLERLLVGSFIAGTIVLWPYKNTISSRPVHIAVPGITHGYEQPSQKEYAANAFLWYATGPSLALLLAWLYDKTKKRTTTLGEALAHKYSLGSVCGTLAGIMVEQYAEELRPLRQSITNSRDYIMIGISGNYLLNCVLDHGRGSIITSVHNICKLAQTVFNKEKILEIIPQTEKKKKELECGRLYLAGKTEEALAQERLFFRDLDSAIDELTIVQELIFPFAFFLSEKIGEVGEEAYTHVSRAHAFTRMGKFEGAEHEIKLALQISTHPYVAFLAAEWRTEIAEQESTLQQWYPKEHQKYIATKSLQERLKESWTEAGKRLENAKELQQVRTISTAEKNILVIDNSYLAESIVLAAPKTPEEKSCIKWEEKTLRHYYAILGDAVPTPIGQISLSNEEYFAERRVGTQTLAQIISRKTFDEQQQKQAIELLAKIHNNTPTFAFNPTEKKTSYFKGLLTKSLNNFLQYNPLLKDNIHKLVEELEAVYSELELQPFALNKDTHPQNWTILHGIVRAIDFGCTSDGPRKGPVLNNLVRLVEYEGSIQENQKTTAKQLQRYLEKTHWQWNTEPEQYYADSGVYDHLLCAGNRMREYLETQNIEKLLRVKEHLKKAIPHFKKTLLPLHNQHSLFFACTNILQACSNN